MDAVRQLALVYTGVIFINLALSAAFWIRYRTSEHRGLVLVWASLFLAGAAQGAPTLNPLGMALVLAPTFLVGLALAGVLARAAGFKLRSRLYWSAMGLGVVASVAIYFAGGAFWAIALGVSIGVALPMIETPFRVLLRKGSQITMPLKAAALSCLAYGLHNLDYPFLRDKPRFAVIGFSLALLIIFAVSITAPAVVLERVTEERTKIGELNEFQRKFFANITHELRTPLTMILAPLESLLALDFGPLTSTQRAYLEANHRNALRLLKLINDLLDLAKKEEGFLKLRPEQTDLRQMMEEVVNYARPLAARKQLALKLEVKSLPQDLRVDVEKMERVLVNLISNALKFTSEGGVTVSIESTGGVVKLSVADTGIGIAPEALPRIFERFNQADGSVTRRFGGTGIGLAYAKEIVDLHGGQITVESTPGQGSCFVVHLREGPDRIPDDVRDRRIAETQASATELRRLDDQEPREWAQRLQRQSDYRFAEIGEATEQRTVTRGEVSSHAARILVVEDNADILELVTLQLRERYSIFVAQNGRAGLELAQLERPDLIITDFMMPEMDGLSMVKELRADPRFHETSIIMLTAKSQLEDRLAVRDAGVDVYLGKPFSPRELDASVRQLLEKRGRHLNNIMRAHAEGLEIVSGGLAHEIQNPLTFIKGAQLMIGEHIAKIALQVAGAALTDPVRVAAIDKSRQRIDRLVQSAGEGISRIEGVVALMRRYAREGYPKEISDVVLDTAVKEVAQLIAPPVDVDCKLTLDLKAPGQMVRCIPEELNQLVRSLVQNAIEAMEAKGVVRVKSRAEGKNLILEVTDNGPGIQPDQVTKIFSPFFTTKTGNGRGLGLAIAQLIVTRAGGSIEVASTPKVETTFRVRLPVATEETAPILRTDDRPSAELGVS